MTQQVTEVERTKTADKDVSDWKQGCGFEQFKHDWNRLLTCHNPCSQPMMRHRIYPKDVDRHSGGSTICV